MTKKELSEEDIKNRYITPAIENAGWDKKQVRMEFPFTDGRVILRGNVTARGVRKKADYLLSYKNNRPLAIVEAKDNKHSVGAGLQQAIDYAEILDIPYVYASNGDGFVEQNLITGTCKDLLLEEFPSPELLWNRYKKDKNLTSKEENIALEPYYYEPGYNKPRYYQRVAINRVVDAVASGQNRILLVMATGTGKTFTAFQFIWRLWKSGTKKKILYLADRNVLIDQTIMGDFKPFGNKMCKVENRKLDSSYEIYLALYQQLSGDEDLEVFKQFQPSFFDLIVIDECHRGSAKEESAWRRILDYFGAATHIGMTATPTETKEASSQTYFGKPLYEYSLKQGIEDGFLAPYKVIRIGLDKDLVGYRPEKGKKDKNGYEIPDREYSIKDFERKLVLEPRTIAVAQKITQFLKKTDRFSKTIVFCIDIEHAERMRQALINENADLYKENNKYVMRITGDNAEGKEQLDNFMDVDSKYPVIAVTSKLMTTGVDAKMCKLIVLDNNIGSMTEFKQIIGRGTRLRPDDGKLYFTLMDFRNASRLFADEGFDGLPPVIIDVGPDDPPIDPPVPTDDTDDNGAGNEGDDSGNNGRPPMSVDPPIEEPNKFYVNDIEVKVLSERVQYYDKDGKLITESLIEYSKRNILNEYARLDAFLQRWNKLQRKEVIIEELKERGVLLDALRSEADKDLDDFDLICHIAYDKKPLTKAERANNVQKRGYLYKYSGIAQEVIQALLDKYKNDGIRDLADTKLLEFSEFARFGSPMKIAKLFGGKVGYEKAVKELEDEIYSA